MSLLDTGLTTQGADKYNYKLQEEFANVGKSKFNYGFTNQFTMDIGQIIPASTFYTIPGSSYQIKVKQLIRCINPPVRPNMSRLWMYTHYFWCPMTMLWKYWQVFFTKGHMRDVNLLIPKCHYLHTKSLVDNKTYEDVRESSLMDYLNVPYGIINNTGKEEIKCEIPLLKTMMYLKVYRDYFLNEELHKKSKAWYPDEDDGFRLTRSRYDTKIEELFSVEPKNYNEEPWGGIVNGEKRDQFAGLGMLEIKYRDWGTDYFTCARTTPLRGPEPSIPMEAKTTSKDLLLNTILESGTDGSKYGEPMLLTGMNVRNTGDFNEITSDSNTIIQAFSGGDHKIPEGKTAVEVKTKLPKGTNIGLSYALTFAALKDLTIKYNELTKMARTDGSYGQEMAAMFGVKPKAANNYKPVYIGGCKQPITFSEVIQTSGDDKTNGNYLGGLGGHAFGVQENGYIGKIHCDDYGIIMGVVSIMPETLYHGGYDRNDSVNVQEELYLPERAAQQPQAILKGEMQYTGDDNYDLDIWGYTNAFDHLRARQNQVHGQLAKVNDIEWGAWTFARSIDMPLFNQNFCSTKNNVRPNWKHAEGTPAFAVEYQEENVAVIPLPYDGTPSTNL